MADKQKDSKIMSMLERKGIIRRSGSETPEPESDIRPVFDMPDEAVTVKTAGRQPIPGMPTPVFPTENASDASSEKEKDKDKEKDIVEDLSKKEEPPAIEIPSVPTPAAPDKKEAAAPPPPPPPVPTPATPAPPPPEPVKTSPFSGLNLFKNGGSSSDAPASEPVAREEQQRPDNYTDRYLNVNELYDALALRSKKTDTIYLIEEYLQTLPDSLPDSQRRDIVGKLLASSGFDFDLLMGDGVLRVKMLKEYAERFARHTDDYIAARQSELDELDQQMQRTRRLIENRKELHKKQFFTIEAEAQRLKEILTFISG